MAGTVITGNGGNFTATGVSGDISAWTFTTNYNEQQIRSFRNSGWINRTYGCADATATIAFNVYNGSGNFPVTSFNSGPVACEITNIVLTSDTGCTISGSGMIQTFTLDRQSCVVHTGTMSIGFHGQPIQSWS